MILFVFTIGACSWGYAQTSPNGPAVINLKMGVTVLPFEHYKHQQRVKNDCRECHATKIGKIDGWGKEAAHKLCISCHDLYDQGPTQCRQCHSKK
jgi:predicted CXXCH cytochrome family protein